MKNGKFAARRSSGSKKVFTVILAALLLVGCSVGATLAWLTATTNKVENTFTVGKVEITLQEHKYVEASNSLNTNETVGGNTYKLIPGKNMPKDPFVTVKANSEPCWVFVRIDESDNSFYTGYDGDNACVAYRLDDRWTALQFDGSKYALTAGVSYYYRLVDASSEDQYLYVLGNASECENASHNTGCVTISADVTASVTTGPTLKFTAAAIQYDGFTFADATDPDIENPEVQAAKEAFMALPTEFTNGVTPITVTP